jgi:putative hydrolase of the HAD superfamily
MSKYTHLFFDLDRTLWDFESNSKETLFELYNKFSLKIYFPDFYSFYKSFNDVNNELWLSYRNNRITKHELRYQRFFKTLQKFGNNISWLAKELDIYYIRHSPLKKKLFPYTIETLKLINPNFKKYILTNGFNEVQNIKVNNSGLMFFFEKIYTSEDIGVHKPAKEFFDFVLNDLMVKPETCLMIGDDSISDIKGAKDSGIDQVFFNPEHLQIHCNPTFQITNLKELLILLN